jgi:hypothetical protein
MSPMTATRRPGRVTGASPSTARAARIEAGDLAAALRRTHGVEGKTRLGEIRTEIRNGRQHSQTVLDVMFACCADLVGDFHAENAGIDAGAGWIADGSLNVAVGRRIFSEGMDP